VLIVPGRYGSAYSPPGSRVFNRVNAPDSGGPPTGGALKGRTKSPDTELWEKRPTGLRWPSAGWSSVARLRGRQPGLQESQRKTECSISP
jgi:hypothetical protein